LTALESGTTIAPIEDSALFVSEYFDREVPPKKIEYWNQRKRIYMADDNSVVRNWRDVQPKSDVPGIKEYELITPEETPAKRVDVSLLIIEPGITYKPEEFAGEAFYYFLAGNGILMWNRLNSDLPFLIDNDTVGWLPGSHTYRFENTGEGPMRCLAVTCKTNETYGMRDGSIGKLNTLSPMIRKVADSMYSTGVSDAPKIRGSGYQVFAPGRAQGLHTHDEEVLYLVRGQGKLISAGKEYELKAGSAAHTPLNIEHRLINTGHDMFGYIVLELAP